MTEAELYKRIKQVTPEVLLSPDYTATRGSASPTEYRYAGFQYPDYDHTQNPGDHFTRSRQDLISFIADFSSLFPGTNPRVNECLEDMRESESVWDESVTDPLFVDMRGRIRGLLRQFDSLTGIPTVLQRLSLEHLRGQRRFNDVLSIGLGLGGEFDPRDERLIVFSPAKVGDCTLSVTSHRYMERFLDGVGLIMVEPGRRLLGVSDKLPILVGVPTQGEEKHHLFEQVMDINLRSLTRVFPN